MQGPLQKGTNQPNAVPARCDVRLAHAWTVSLIWPDTYGRCCKGTHYIVATRTQHSRHINSRMGNALLQFDALEGSYCAVAARAGTLP